MEKPIGKPTPPPEKKATTRIPSIAAIKNKIVAEPDIKDNVSEIEHDVVLKQELFTTEELDAAWEKFKEIKQKDGKDQEVALLNQTYILKDNTITINSTNDVFTIIFNDLKADMQIFLRKELRNGKIKLAIETMELDESKMIYTNREKFNHLIEKYPDLKILKDKLGLDTDF